MRRVNRRRVESLEESIGASGRILADRSDMAKEGKESQRAPCS